MVINGAIVSDLDMMYLESVLQEEQALCMMMRYVRLALETLSGRLRLLMAFCHHNKFRCTKSRIIAININR